MTHFSIDRYFNRIRFHGAAIPSMETVTAMMRAQLLNVPFENLDIQAGKIISLDPEDIAEKIIHRRRGGYCFEVNGLFSMALDALQIPYFFITATPLSQHGVRKPKTHMAIIVELNNEKWLCDCGFGGYGMRAPMSLKILETEVPQDGDAFMLSQLNEWELVLKTKLHDSWEAQYMFDLTKHNWTDFTAANDYSSTHPDSLFVRKLLIVLCTPVGRKILFGNTLKINDGDRQEKYHLTPENRAAFLREEFGLVE